MKKAKGMTLAQQMGLDCEQAYFSAQGNWFSKITKFPCALFDEKGFLLVKSEDELIRHGIAVKKSTNVPHLISSLPGYRLLEAWRSLPEESPTTTAVTEYIEGALERIAVNRYERDPKARSMCIKHHGSICAACDTRLSDVYGAVAIGYIHVHHIVPIATIKAEYQLDPVRDLIPLCPNCHTIVHLRQEPFTIEEVKTMLRNRREKA
jgi:5-methylcytosine-specific restriction endonuclease McrA